MDNQLKETVSLLMKKKGKVIGEIFHLNRDYIHDKEGNNGVKQVEDKVKELTGFEFSFENIFRYSWYPLGLSVVIVLVAKELFNWTEDDIFEMGASTAKVSFVLKLVSYLNKPKEVLERAPFYWKRYYDFGSLEITEFDKKNKQIKVNIKDFSFHPLWCLYTAGYFLTVLKFFIRGKDMKIKEIQCSHKKGSFEEYQINWN
jgi:hypothetical protein